METTFLGMTLTELTGYLASAFVLISFLNRNIIRLRIINSIGCALFVAYGIMLAISWPIVITNACILLIHAYYLLLKKPVSA
ncbi:MAG: uroporphyrinogen decarboxylase [Crocinitomicaceae bacterium]|nr:uroporphyrinogen decarboxylase [Crocinitomicaceae bacterium]